jgi:hypothetical protein
VRWFPRRRFGFQDVSEDAESLRRYFAKLFALLELSLDLRDLCGFVAFSHEEGLPLREHREESLADFEDLSFDLSFSGDQRGDEKVELFVLDGCECALR